MNVRVRLKICIFASEQGSGARQICLEQIWAALLVEDRSAGAAESKTGVYTTVNKDLSTTMTPLWREKTNF
jgi:hypothetical protein